MNFEELVEYGAAYNLVAERLEVNPSVHDTKKGAVAPYDVLREADQIFSDLFKAETSEVLGEISVLDG